jgi:uncharacterized protein (TIGR02996 family)
VSQERDLLIAVLAQPGEVGPRLVYADWLEERGEQARAELLRADPALERIRFVDWMEPRGHLPYYTRTDSQLRQEAQSHADCYAHRMWLRSHADHGMPGWYACLTSLGCPFEAFRFFNNSEPRGFAAEEMPFRETLGTRGWLVTLESAFGDETSWSDELLADLAQLRTLPLEDCAYGAASCPLHPFAVPLAAATGPITAAAVVEALRPRRFRGPSAAELAATRLGYPGYRPSTGADDHQDEIHGDFEHQNLFAHNDEDAGGAPGGETAGAHGLLSQWVAGGQLWYVLLHTLPRREEEFVFSRYAVLFAVGKSLRGDRLLGVISHQVCHNLCD